MQIEELRNKISERLDFLSDHWIMEDKKPFSFGGWREEVLDEVMQLISDYVGGVIGEDDNTPDDQLTPVGQFVKSDLNTLREEQRERAGLSSIEEGK